MFSTFNFVESDPVEIHSKINSGGFDAGHQIEAVSFSPKIRSRNGCLHCKKMKKKCDQQKPSCSMCLRKSVSCVYRNMEVSKNKVCKSKVSTTTTTTSRMSEKGISVRHDVEVKSSDGTIAPSDMFKIDSLTPTKESDSLSDEGDEIALDESQVVENVETRDGLFNDEKLFQILAAIIKGDITVDQCWVSPKKIRYFKQLRRIHQQSKALLRSPSSSSIFLKLDEMGSLFFENYQHITGTYISVSPRASDNYFKSLFIPLAEYDESILYALTAWGGMTLAGGNSVDSRRYMEKGQEKVLVKMAKINNEFLKNESDRNISNADVLIVLSFYLICIGAEVSTGDVYRWTSLMETCHHILSKIGLKDFLLNSMSSHAKEALWLISNFFYHDVTHLAKRATSFSMAEYEEVLVYGGHLMGRQYGSIVEYGIDPLNGCNTALYLIMCEIINSHHEFTTLEAKFQNAEAQYDKDELSSFEVDTIIILNGRRQILLDEFAETCDLLERKIQDAKPNLTKLADLDQRSLELQLTSFELLQLTLTLLVNLLLRKKPPAARENQVLLISILDDIKILIGTSLETSLSFPLTIAGLCCYKKYDRFLVKDYFRRVMDSDISHFPNRNLDKGLRLAQEYWIQNPNGHSIIDWYDIIKELQWELSLA